MYKHFYLLGLAALLSTIAFTKVNAQFSQGELPTIDNLKDWTLDEWYDMYKEGYVSTGDGDQAHSAPSAPPVQVSQCAGDGMQVCRCYCRTSIPVCQNNNVTYSSMPLCKEPWAGGDCSSISYYYTGASTAASCSAINGNTCNGHIRPGNGNPAELANQEVQGPHLGCEIVAL